MISKSHSLLFALVLTLAACGQTAETKNTMPQDMPTNNLDSTETITLGAGCFWCVEAIFQSIEGVISAKSGYSGGAVMNPSYKEVCAGTTGHAEVVQVIFDPAKVTLAEILEVFFATHDPTTMNRQGADEGTQYRSAIFYHSDAQKQIADMSVKAALESKEWANPIITEVTAFDVFYPAEDYHQDYFSNNGDQPYCSRVIAPKMDKFKKKFADKLKGSN